MILIERNRLSGFLGRAYSTIGVGVHRGKLIEEEGFTESGRPVKGITLESARIYWEWSPATVDELLMQHDIHPDTKDSWFLKAMFEVDQPGDEVGYGRHQFPDMSKPCDPKAMVWRSGYFLKERLKHRGETE